jgi:D-amino acid aminotransferase
VGDFANVNGRLIPESEAVVSVKDHGFLYGDGVFETIRIYGAEPFLLRDHIARLTKGLAALQIDYVPEDTLQKGVYSVIEANGFRDAVVRIAVTRGQGAGRMRLAPDAAPTVVITCDELAGVQTDAAERGVAVITVPDNRGGFTGIKNLSCIANIMARKEADSRGVYEAIFRGEDTRLLEGSTSNVFGVESRRLVTARLDGRILPGVTRRLVIDLARKIGLPVAEQGVAPAEVDELFITNSVIEIIPVTTVDGLKVGDGRPGKITAALQSSYRSRIHEVS